MLLHNGWQFVEGSLKSENHLFGHLPKSLLRATNTQPSAHRTAVRVESFQNLSIAEISVCKAISLIVSCLVVAEAAIFKELFYVTSSWRSRGKEAKSSDSNRKDSSGTHVEAVSKAVEKLDLCLRQSEDKWRCVSEMWERIELSDDDCMHWKDNMSLYTWQRLGSPLAIEGVLK